ncbi:hypothetical protein C8R43DRAFT_1014766 [Mycena crocata]|nr:hypothetical protein C8R43DRAFT_1014766 [Mycena crocata]
MNIKPGGSENFHFHPIMRDKLISQLQSSIQVLLEILSLIPHHAIRYTALGLVVFVSIIYVVYVKHPTTQLRQLDAAIEKTLKTIEKAKGYCRDRSSLLEESVKLMAIERSASKIHSRMLKCDLTWNKYRHFSKDIAEHAEKVAQIGTSVQLTIEAEHQRRCTQEINETMAILASITPPGQQVFQPRMSPVHSV